MFTKRKATNMQSKDETAVNIKDLCKSYPSGNNGKELVLNKFCMSVEKGSMCVKKSS